MSVDAVILAGGYSTRADGFKMEFDIEGKTILQRCIEGFYDSCRKIIVVTGFKYEKIEKLVKDYEKVVTVYNDNYPKGMFTSIKKGISQVESEKFFLTPGDYPLINKKVIEEILTKSIKVKNENKEVIILYFYGKGGHPILADSSIVQDILVKSDDYNLREFLKNRKVAYEIIEDKSIILDVDTAQDYNEALSEFNKKLI
ncbi:nucleotidyltransferase family protein [Clostridium butyricum]|uniref:nucleotidyltransferase family protein n=1 Tax=Clostridium butyricum TaxID=1492 RepID=UPI0009043CB3|nr:NTP transferase domain-containing protein [Clostridium butyricum]APF21473.1 guanylyl transferase CofC like family protein [Clostridium butyricum]